MYDWKKYSRVGMALLKRLDRLGPFIHPIKRQFLLARVDRMRKREEIRQESVQYHFIEAQKQQSFTDPSQASDAEALGILLANFWEWAGEPIFETAEAALEDANFHTESAALAQMRAAL